MCRQFGYDKTNGSQDLTSCSDKCAGLRDTSLGQTSTFLRVPSVGKQVHLDCFCRSDLLKFSEMHSKEVKRCFLNKALSCLEDGSFFFVCCAIQQLLHAGSIPGLNLLNRNIKQSKSDPEKTLNSESKLLAQN